RPSPEPRGRSSATRARGGGGGPAGRHRDRRALATFGTRPISLIGRHRVLPAAAGDRVLDAGQRGDRPAAIGTRRDRGGGAPGVALGAIALDGNAVRKDTCGPSHGDGGPRNAR